MSYDFATAAVCPHQVFFEACPVDQGTKRSCSFPRPPNNSGVAVYVDRVPVPKSGLWSTASLPFFKPGPYRVQAGVNDLLLMAVGFGMPRLLQLTPGPAVSASDMAIGLQRQLPDFLVYADGKRVVVSTRGPSRGTAFQFHDPRWTDRVGSLPTTARVLGAYSEVGIVPGRAVTGTKIFPGWSVQLDPSSPVIQDRILLFDEPLPNADPLVELSYVTAAQYCRRCFGTRVEYDYTINNGTYDTVQNTDLLVQEFEKFLLTKIGSHWKWSWLGSGLVDRIGGKGNTASSSVNALISVDVTQAFATYQSLKTGQEANFPQQKVTDAEFPLQLGSVDVQLLPNDPTVAVLNAVIVSRSQVEVPLARVVGNPNPFSALNGDPAQTLRRLPGG
jgi:hypothetical protein